MGAALPNSGNLKEQRAAKKLAKQKLFALKTEKDNIKKAKKQRAYDLKNDHISYTEIRSSVYDIYFAKVVKRLEKNNVIVDDLIQDYIQLHRFTYWPCEYDFTNIRTIIEGMFETNCAGYDVSTIHSTANKKVYIHYKQRELLLMFTKVISNEIITCRSRLKFAELNQEMITSHTAYTFIMKGPISNFLDIKSVKEAQETILLKLKSKEIYNARIKNKSICINETGDLICG